MWFQITLTQGRADSIFLEADNKNDVLTFFDTVSTAVVTSIKRIVFSKKYNVNYIDKIPNSEPTYKEVLVFAKSKTYSKVFRLYNVKRSITEEQLLKSFEKLNILNEKINDIYNIQFVAKEGFSPMLDVEKEVNL